MSYSERTQVLLTPEQRQKVELLAASTSTSVGAVVRAAIDAYGPGPSPEQRARAADALLSLDLPVADWDEIEREIEDGYRT